MSTDAPRDRATGIGIGIDVVDHHARALGRDPGRERRADPVPGSGHDHTLAFDRGVSHAASPRANVIPPSTTNVAPVIHPASSDRKNVTAPAMSEGTPRRPSGYDDPSSASRSS